MKDVRLHLVDSFDTAIEFRRWLGERRAGRIAVDTETAGLEWWRMPVRTIQVGDAQDGWTLPVEGHMSWGALAAEALEQHDGETVWQNLKFDVHFLEQGGWKVDTTRAHDTRVMAHLHDNDGRTGLKTLAARYVDTRVTYAESTLKESMRAGGWTWATVPLDLPAHWTYAALDTVLTARVADELWPEVRDRWAQPYDVEMACQLVLIDMERRGLRIDREYCARAAGLMRVKQAALTSEAAERWGVNNPNSNAQIIARLQEDEVTFTKRTKKGNISLDEEVLDSLDHPLTDLVKEWRHLDKIVSSYLDNFLDLADDDGILHPSINLLGAKTGRMSVSSPSLQNLERTPTVRDAFVPRDEDHVLVLVDYDQIELRLLAHYAQEGSMIAAIWEGRDLHTEMTRRIYDIPEGDNVPREKRQLTKNGTFAKLYGAGVTKFAQTVGVAYADAERFLAAYDKRFPTVRAFQNAVLAEGERRLAEEGSAYVTTWLGRRLRVGDDRTYRLVNYLIQGVAAEVLKVKMVELDLAGLTDYLVLPVHDELVFDVPRAEVTDFAAEVVSVLEDRDNFSVPLTVGHEVVERWGDKYREETLFGTEAMK